MNRAAPDSEKDIECEEGSYSDMIYLFELEYSEQELLSNCGGRDIENTVYWIENVNNGPSISVYP